MRKFLESKTKGSSLTEEGEDEDKSKDAEDENREKARIISKIGVYNTYYT